MAGRIDSAWLDELCSRVSIDELISEYVPLNRKGRYLWACCPFHGEKTPSFKVDPENGMFYCFGCHKGGNVITFLKEYEHIESRDAIKELAERAHMEMPEASPVNRVQEDLNRDLQDKVYEANIIAARFYHSYIWKPEGAQALKYLYSRGLTDSDIKRFGLGCSPLRGTELHDLLIEKGFTEEVIQKAWLSGEKEGYKYDMFRDRVMFPIINAKGKVLGFGGRIMGKGEPKYMNTSDTPVFLKRNGVYGINFLYSANVPKQTRLVLVEGYMDTVMLLKQGIHGVVATLGTALTEEQVRLLKRYVHEVWISYDGDGAGRKAALRALDMFEPSGMEVKVIDYPNNMDPDEYIKAFGRQAWENLPKHKPAKYRMLRAADGLDMSKQEDVTKYTIECCAILKKLNNAVELENYLRELSTQTGYSREVLLKQIGISVEEKSEVKPQRAPKVTARVLSESDMAQMQLICLAASGMVKLSALTRQDFDSELYGEIFDNLLEGVKPRDFIENLPDEQKQQTLEALNSIVLPENDEKALILAEELLSTIRRTRINSRISVLTEKLKTAQGDETVRLTEELNNLLTKLD